MSDDSGRDFGTQAKKCIDVLLHCIAFILLRVQSVSSNDIVCLRVYSSWNGIRDQGEW